MKKLLTLTLTHLAFASALIVAAFAPAFAFAESGKFSPQVIKIYDEQELEELREEGARILRRRGDILLCLIPTADDNEIVIPNSSRKIPVKRNSSKRRIPGDHRHGFTVPTLDVAKSHYDAIDISTGNGFSKPYTGKGVVVGICDIGFDPLHPTFLDVDGKSRVRRITQYKEREGVVRILEGDSQYEEWGTDNPDNFHATHVCGILAGNGAGTPYSGIATDADIVVSTSTLSDVGLLAGVEDIIDYAKEVGKPAVINLSMGNYTGAHDGTSLFSQYLDMCAEDAIIVLSSGNEGARTNYLSGTFSTTAPDVAFRLGNSEWDQIDMYGITDLWSLDSSPLSVEIGIFDGESRKMVCSYPAVTLCDDDVVKFEWDTTDPAFEGCPLDGYLLMTGGVCRENGRYRAMLMYDYTSPQKVEGGWARYVVAVKVAGDPGNGVDVFADGSYTRLMTLPGYPAPDSSMSVSDLACGHNVICVGMYANRATIPVSVPDGAGWTTTNDSTGMEGMTTVKYSSYGTLRDGRVLPHTVAPGTLLLSSLSRQYLDSHPTTECLRLDAPWIAEGGTSMASPFVAGYIATWLEAAPRLSALDARRLILSTNRTDMADMADPRNAHGWFDPKAALSLAIKENAGTEYIKNHPRELNPEDDVEIFKADGARVFAGKMADCRPLPSGVYIIRGKGLAFKFISR